MLRRSLYLRVYNHKFNRLHQALSLHLMEIIPTNEVQRKTLPVLEIMIGMNFSMNMHVQIRNGKYQKKCYLKHSSKGEDLWK